MTVTAFAATEGVKITYSLDVGGENNITRASGETITVLYAVTPDSRARTSTTQNQIVYDHTFFQLVENSIKVMDDYSEAIATSTPIDTDGTHYIYYNSTANINFSANKKAEIGTFQLKIIAKSGSSTVTNTKCIATDANAVEFDSAVSDLTVTIGGSSVAVTGVELNKDELALELDGEESLVATVLPTNATNKGVTWSSTDETVATVDENGKVTAVGVGNATIIVTTADGSKTDSCKVAVSKKTQTITAANQTVCIGSSLNIAASTNAASDGATLTYAIAGEAPDGVTLVGNVLTVAGTAAEGTVTININSAETTNYAAAQQKQITITISAKTDAGVSITDPGAKTYGDDDFTLDVDVETEGTNGEYSYESSNPSVLSVDDEGNVTVVGAGEATITVTYSSDTSFDESSVAVTVAPKALTITGVEATDRDYEEGNTDVELTGGELVGVVGDDDVNFTLGSGTASADEGEDLAVTTNIQLTGGDAGNYTLTQPQDVTVTITKVGPTPCPRDETCPIDPFEDTLNDFWWHDGIHFCLEKRTIKDRETRIMSGFEDGTFQPNGYLTREQIVNMLWNMEGQPQVEYNMTFKDVANDRWSANAIRWAQSEGVVSGHSDEEFAPADYVTREQLMSILHRYAKYKEKQGAFTDDLTAFADKADIHSWFTDDVQWAVGAGIVHGDAGMLDPLGNTTRAQAAVMIHNFCINILEW